LPKITKLRLHLLKLPYAEKNCGLFFSGHGVSSALTSSVTDIYHPTIFVLKEICSNSVS